jgi:hypothetical protein
MSELMFGAMKTATLFILCVVCLLATAGCEVFMPGTTSRTVAGPYVKPYFAALESYHKSHKQYPETLDMLRPEYPKLLDGFQSSNDGINGTLYTKVKGQYVDWTLTYKREAADTYVLGFQRGDAFVSYKNGKVISADSKWWM